MKYICTDGGLSFNIITFTLGILQVHAYNDSCVLFCAFDHRTLAHYGICLNCAIATLTEARDLNTYCATIVR